ncbi:hypothetical protein CBS101457_004771 [Exobasidium rhododendri]|nr:hypothetical protein CBS101457_004771 [Exobasidium rhododendri]
MQNESAYWVHICLYSHSPAPFTDIFSTELGPRQESGLPSKHSLDEIQRKVDRPLDARFTPLSIQALDLPQRLRVAQKGLDRGEMSLKANAPKKKAGGSQSSHLHQRAPSSPIPHPQVEVGSPLLKETISTPVSTSSRATSTPVARFIKESSFSVEDEEDGYIHRQKALEISFGIVHLFRDDAALNDSANAKAKTALEDDTGVILAILGVPSHIGPADFLQFVEPATDAISQVRMIREERAQRCMVLLKFREATNAEEFHKLYADQPFDSLHDPDELCRVVYVTKITISTTSTLPYAYPLLANSDPWPILTNHVVGPSSHSESNALTHRLAGSVSVELPTCPVCLERMDASVTGLMTVTCQHTFHCSCLSRWSDSRCPVCRYTQSRMIRKGHYVTPSFVPEHGSCAICGTGSDLWVCLICATLGCGRYKAGHAHRHHQETGHLYSLELETQRVWDYAGDGYVHRLIQNKAESKTIDEGGPTPASYREASLSKGSRQMMASSSVSEQSRHEHKGEGSSEVEEKMEAIGLEYSHLLSTQLESQRAFYEDQVRVFQRRAEDAEGSRGQMKWQVEQTDQERKDLKRNLDIVTSRYESVHKNLEKSLSKMKILDEDLKGERLMSRGLIGKIEKVEAESERSRRDVQVMRMENQELREQVRDLMVFLETRDTIEREGGEEMRGGGVAVGKGKKSSTIVNPPPVGEVNSPEPAEEAKLKTAKSKKKKAKGRAKISALDEFSAGRDREDEEGDEVGMGERER